MRYCELCRAFYISTTVGGLKEAASQGAIAEYFIRAGLSEESVEKVMPTNPSAYDKWYSGINGQRANVWTAFGRDCREKEYAGKLCNAFGKEENLKIAVHRLGIGLQEGKDVERDRLAIAIARQMLAFSQGKGEAENIINDVYSVNEIKQDFSEYIQKAAERYNVMKLLGGNEAALEDYFVCNTLGESPRVITDKSSPRGSYLDDATIEKIRGYYEKRGFDNKKTILIGGGGTGKTLMLQHLFLDGIEKYPETGILPIFLELRYFTQKDDIRSFLYDTVNAKDNSFTEQIEHQLLLDGRCPILMDGLDEIDPSDIDDFQMKLNAFSDKYPRTQIIIASRDCAAINGMNGYTRFYVWPFDSSQSTKLIDKIVTANGNPAAKDDIVKYIDNGFIKKRGVFASHPMLLTFVAMNYTKFDIFHQSHLAFYKAAYQALLTGHDDNKKPYDRVFHSVDSPEQFSTVFREFCGETYRRGILEFTDASFDLHFSKLTTYKNFENPLKMDAKSFRHDVCATACMMYEKELKVCYLDPGFQEFLFAEYYSQQEPVKVLELEKSLEGQALEVYGKLDAFDMLYELSEVKFKMCILKPFLDLLFAGRSDEEAFSTFLTEGYESISYSVFDEELIRRYEEGQSTRSQLGVSSLNEPRTVILSYLYKLLGEKEYFRFSTAESNAGCEDFVKNVFTGEKTLFHGSEHILYLQRRLKSQFDDRENFERTNNTANMIRDGKGEIVCFGYEYKIDMSDIEEEPDKFKNLIYLMMQEESEIYQKFLRVKDFYRKLKRELRKKDVNY